MSVLLHVSLQGGALPGGGHTRLSTEELHLLLCDPCSLPPC